MTSFCGVRPIYIAVFFTRKVNVKGGNRWLRSLRDHNHLCQVWGSLQPVKGALRRYAPLTGFPLRQVALVFSVAFLPFEHGNDSALYITVNVNQRFAYECCIAFAGVVTLPNLMGSSA